jgi:hypothetical protein
MITPKQSGHRSFSPQRCRRCTCALVISVVALLSCARGALRDRPLAEVFQRFLQGAGFRNVTLVEVEGHSLLHQHMPESDLVRKRDLESSCGNNDFHKGNCEVIV